MYTRVVLAASKFISFFSPKATTTSASKPKETSVLDSKNIHAETRYMKFLADYFPTVSLFVFVFEILTITVVNSYRATSSINSSLAALPCSMPSTFKANERCYKRI